MLLLLLAVTAIGLLTLRSLIAVVMLSGIYSLITAALFVLMDAPDVALTEAAVGAGAATVLMLGAISLTVREQKPVPVRVVPLLIVAATG
ncbi:MAG: hydrogenase subunit MbhD domain-containing protein, partial [Acetobacterales bacterium]